MPNFNDPTLIAKEFAAFLSFLHCLDGIFIWEFFMSMKLDWDCFTGKRKFKWTYVLYSLSRLGTLGNIICNLIFFNVSGPVNCQVLMVLALILGYIAFAAALALMALRIIAIWNHNHLVAAVVIGICLTNIGFFIYGIVKARSTWSPTLATCVLENTFESRDNITVTMASDVVMLVIMLVGLLHSRQSTHGVVRHLYAQGSIWLTAATIAQIPATVFINLNLNVPWNVMFQAFASFTMVICATRMYRALIVSDMEVEKYSSTPTVLSRLRFTKTTPKGTTVTAASNTALPKSNFDTYRSTDDVELNLTEKTVAVGDEEAQSHEMPGLRSRDGR